MGAKKVIKAETVNKLIGGLRKIEGYKACGLLTSKGRFLLRDVFESGTNLDLIGTTFTELLDKANIASENVELGSCSELVVVTPNNTIIASCSGVDAIIHLHLVVVLTSDSKSAPLRLVTNNFFGAAFNDINSA